LPFTFPQGEGDVRAELEHRPSSAGRAGTTTVLDGDGREPKKRTPSIEIRAATRGELEQVLTVRGRAFQISRSQWPSPDDIDDADLERIRVVVVDGKVVSSLTMIPATIQIGSARVPMGGIGNVSTLPEEQNRGYATALMKDTLRVLGEQGFWTSVLFPFSFTFYRKFGYELGGNQCQYWSRPRNIPAFGERRHCRDAGPDDLSSLSTLYAQHSSIRSCGLVRDEERWRRLMGNGSHSLVYDRQGPDGYLIYNEEIDSHGLRVLRVKELVATSPESGRGLVGFLAAFDGDTVEWSTTPADLWSLGLMCPVAPLREGYKPRGIATVRPMFQFRVIDVLQAIKARSPEMAWLDGELSLVIQDELNPDNAQPLAVSCSGGTVQIVRGHRTHHCLEANIRVFSQIYCGYLTPTEAASQGLITIRSDETLRIADQIFPKYEPFIPEVDRF
jgi:predicted acetyltransferase